MKGGERQRTSKKSARHYRTANGSADWNEQ
nr:MAG TPA: hypothetical protein [Caudoviricetes sp.]